MHKIDNNAQGLCPLGHSLIIICSAFKFY